MSVNNVGIGGGGDAAGSQYANNGFSNGGSFGTTGGAQDSAGSKLQNDAHTLSDDIKGGKDKETTGNDAKKLLGDYKESQNSGINPDKAGSLEDIQNLLEQILKQKGGQQAGGGQQSGGGQQAGGGQKGGGESFEDIIKAFIKALEESKGGDESQKSGDAGKDGQSQDGQNGQDKLSGPQQNSQDAQSFTSGGSFGGGTGSSIS